MMLPQGDPNKMDFSGATIEFQGEVQNLHNRSGTSPLSSVSSPHAFLTELKACMQSEVAALSLTTSSGHAWPGLSAAHALARCACAQLWRRQRSQPPAPPH